MTETKSDFPLMDIEEAIEKEESVEVTFIRRYEKGFFKTKTMYMSATMFRKLLKDSAAKPSWQIWDVVTDHVGNVVKENGKDRKQWYDCVEPEKFTKTNSLP